MDFSLRLSGGKGGFGSLLRGAATRAGQKKTSNYDDCRDLNGRRIKDLRNEKRLAEWTHALNERVKPTLFLLLLLLDSLKVSKDSSNIKLRY